MNTATISAAEFADRFSKLGLDAQYVDALLEFLGRIDVEARSDLIKHGVMYDTMYFVHSGKLRLTLHTPTAELEIGTASPGDWVGEFGFLSPGEANVTVSAVEPSTLFALSHGDLLKLLDKAPQVASDLLQGLSLNLANRLRETNTDVLVKGGEHEYTLQHAEPSPNTSGRHESLLVRLRTLLGIGE